MQFLGTHGHHGHKPLFLCDGQNKPAPVRRLSVSQELGAYLFITTTQVPQCTAMSFPRELNTEPQVHRFQHISLMWHGQVLCSSQKNGQLRCQTLFSALYCSVSTRWMTSLIKGRSDSETVISQLTICCRAGLYL